MKITFVSNYFNHHQLEFSETMYKLHGENYKFIATEKMSQERKKLGYGNWEIPSYVIDISDLNFSYYNEINKVLESSDVIIIGSAPKYIVNKCIKLNKIIFRYSERLFKNDVSTFKLLKNKISLYLKYAGCKSMYLLSAGGYVTEDYKRLGLFTNKSFKWGYFPEKKIYDIDLLMSKKRKKSILWCGRFIEWKHPEIALYVAKQLKDKGIAFNMHIIGTGEMEKVLYELRANYGVEDNVTFLGSMSPICVRKEMELSTIFLFTSDQNEGWGAVLNEAMNSGCSVIASKRIGAVPYLIKNKINGYVYTTRDELTEIVAKLLKDEDECCNLGKEAYQTIIKEWNGEVAAKRLSKLIYEIKTNNVNYMNIFDEGICSSANNSNL